MENKEFGVYLSQLREKSGYKSQRQFAIKTGISSATLSRIESGIQRPLPETLEVLAKYLVDVDYNELMKAAGYLPGADFIIQDEKGNTTFIEVKRHKVNKNELEEALEDPEFEIFFKELKGSPEENRKKALEFLKFLNEQEKK